MGSGTHCLKTDGFPGTHGTHANGATALAEQNTTKNLSSWENETSQKKYQNANQL